MKLQEIKNAILAGKTVCWAHEGYQVMGDDLDDLSIVCLSNSNSTGLTWRDGVTLNGHESEFFVVDN
jgi:hypothetical protein